MDRHGPLQVAIGRSPIHGIEYAMDRLVAARPEDRARRGSLPVSAWATTFMKP